MKILITGCSKGLGRGLTDHYLDQGHEVYGISRSLDDSLTTKLAGHSSIDLSQLESILEGLRDLMSDVESLDLVVLNAGALGEIQDIKNASTVDMKQLMDINMWSNHEILKTLFEIGVDLHKVVLISSGASVNGSHGWSGYSLSKAAANMLIKLYASEEPDTLFYAFAPGLVDTAMQDYLCEEVDQARFQSAARIAAARGTDSMPLPHELAPRMVVAFDKLSEYESGSFVDIRKM